MPRKSEGSFVRVTSKGIASSRISLDPVIRITLTVCPSRGKLPVGTDVVSWLRSVIPASSTASATVAAFVRIVRARPSAMIVTVRSVRTSSARPSRPMGREREADRYAPSARTPSCSSAPSTVAAVVHTLRRCPSSVRCTGRP